MPISPRDLIKVSEDDLDQVRRTIDAHLESDAQGILLCGVTNVPLGKEPNVFAVAKIVEEYKAAGWSVVKLHKDDWQPQRYFLLLKTGGLL